MDQGRSGASKATRWLAWAVACLVTVGAVSAGVRVADGDRPGRAVVTAAGNRPGTVDVTSTVTVPVPPVPTTTAPPTTVATTTTLPKAAVEVLRAIAGSTTTTRPPATTTTTTPTPTTAPTAPTSTSPPTTVPARFTVTLANNHTHSVVLTVNGQEFPLAPTQTVDGDLPISGRGDVVQVRLAGDANCGVSDVGALFSANARYRLTIVVGDTKCSGSDLIRPRLNIDRL